MNTENKFLAVTAIDMDIAKVCHQANKAFCEEIGDSTQKDWDKAEEWQRNSAASGVAFRMQNPNAPISARHDAWMRDKLEQGWIYGKVKDSVTKTHPCLIPYNELPIEQKLKDRLFTAIVDAFTIYGDEDFLKS